MSKEKEKQVKEDDVMLAVAVETTEKQMILHDLKDSLIELNKKRKDNNYIQSNAKSSWRELFEDEDD